MLDKQHKYLAAAGALNVPLPQDQTTRMSVNMSRFGSRTGLGVGVAYMLDDSSQTAFTFAVAKSGGETAMQGSLSFEFGGERRIRLDRMAAEVRSYNFATQPQVKSADSALDEDIQNVQQSQQAIDQRQDELDERLTALENTPAPEPVIVQQEAPPPPPAPVVEKFTKEQRQAVYTALGIDE